MFSYFLNKLRFIILDYDIHKLLILSSNSECKATEIISKCISISVRLKVKELKPNIWGTYKVVSKIPDIETYVFILETIEESIRDKNEISYTDRLLSDEYGTSNAREWLWIFLVNKNINTGDLLLYLNSKFKYILEADLPEAYKDRKLYVLADIYISLIVLLNDVN